MENRPWIKFYEKVPATLNYPDVSMGCLLVYRMTTE